MKYILILKKKKKSGDFIRDSFLQEGMELSRKTEKFPSDSSIEAREQQRREGPEKRNS